MSGEILVQQTLDNIYVSKPAVLYLLEAISDIPNISIDVPMTPFVQCELDNIRNLLQNTLERFEEPKPENFDLIGG